MGKITFLIFGFAFGVIAILELLFPEILFAKLDIVINGPSSFAEIRAAYFGTFGTFSIIF